MRPRPVLHEIASPRPRPAITVRPRPRPKKWSRDHAGLETSLVVCIANFRISLITVWYRGRPYRMLPQTAPTAALAHLIFSILFPCGLMANTLIFKPITAGQ